MKGIAVGWFASIVPIADLRLRLLRPITASSSSPILLRLPSLPHRHRPLAVFCTSWPMESSPRGADGNTEIKNLETNEKPRPPPPPSPTAAEVKSSLASPDPPLDPPEKPLPGDCCGSGCVRCVWDVYYEELEAYNKSLALASESDEGR